MRRIKAARAFQRSPERTYPRFHLLESNLGSSITKQRDVVIIRKSERKVNFSSHSNLRMNNHILQHSTPRVLSGALKHGRTSANDRDVSVGLDSVGRQEHNGVSKASAGEVRVVDGHDVAVLLVGQVAGLGVEEEAGCDG